jgi:cytochrome c oxidase subunit 2
MAALLSLAWAGAAFAEMRLNLQDQHTALGRAIDDLHNTIVIICLVIFVAVFGAMFWAIWKHRKSVGHQAALFHENTTVEMVWTIIPFIILLGMAYPATRTLLEQRDTSAPDMTVKVTGYQWQWRYEYLQDDVSFYSTLATPREQIENLAEKGPNYLLEVDKPMVVPVGKKVRVLTTAADVLHAWYVPALAVKQDAIPGFIRDAWFRVETPGTYRGQCAELCGKEHAYMPIVVQAVTEEEYRQWVAEHKTQARVAPAAGAQADAGAADGKGVYDQVCQVCHAAGLAGAPKTGDKAAWVPRVAQGELMYEHAIAGLRMMPAKGGNPNLSDAQVKAAVDYMVVQSK